MLRVAFKMLVGDKAKFIGLIFGIFLSSFLVSQQTSIFLGLLQRSYRLITDSPTADIWVMDKGTENMDKIREMSDSKLDIVKSVPGVEWATPLAFTYLPIQLPNGLFHMAQVVAIDADTFMGAPQKMVEGSFKGLRHEGGIILDQHAVRSTLLSTNKEGKVSMLKVGDVIEVSNHRAEIVGVANLTLGFYPQPVIYVGYEQYQQWVPNKTHHLSFILVRALPGVDTEKLAQKIQEMTGLAAYTTEGFKDRSIRYFLGTGILINFGITVFSGFLLGIAIVGNMFYMLILDYLPYFAMLRAIGTKASVIKKMIYFQALVAGLVGIGLGVGTAALAGILIIASQGNVAFYFPPAILFITTISVFFICLVTASLAIRRVLKEDPKTVM